MANLNVRMSDEEYEKIKKDSINLGFGTNEKPGISDYIRFLTKNAKVSVTIEKKKGED